MHALFEPVHGVEETRRGLFDTVRRDQLCLAGRQRCGDKSRAQWLAAKLREHDFRAPIHGAQEKYGEEEHSEKPDAREDAHNDEREPVRLLQVVEFLLALNGYRILDAMEARFDRVIVPLGQRLGVLTRLIERAQNRLLLLLQLFVGLDNLLHQRSIGRGGSVVRFDGRSTRRGERQHNKENSCY